jgi:release factor glutamine methyltransferase
MILKDVLTKSIQFFKDKKIESYRLDAELLISSALKIPRISLYLKYEQPLNEAEVQLCRDYVRRRSLGEPVAYIVQEKGFFGQVFFVQPGVLVPRPETEHLVELVLDFISKNKIENPRILDLGCGSGCVGLSILKQLPTATLVAIDISEVAFQTTQKNSERLDLTDRVQVIQADVDQFNFSDLGLFDCVVSNPPYIDKDDLQVQKSVVQFEPHQALFADEKGLSFLKNWTKLGLKVLNKTGLMAFEMGHEQGLVMKNYFESLDVFSDVQVVKDLAEKDRIIKGELKC